MACVKETLKGWFITYIDRDLETLFKERLKKKRLRSNMAEEKRQEQEIKRQIARAEQFRPSISGSSRPDRSGY